VVDPDTTTPTLAQIDLHSGRSAPHNDQEESFMPIVPSADGTMSRIAQTRRILLTMALALASMLAMTIAPPAHAQDLDEEQDQAQIACPANRICLYEHINYGGRIAYYAIGSRDMSLYGPRFNDMTSSIRNNSPYRWCVYQHANYGLPVKVINPWQPLPSLPSGWNDVISSLRRC
jgi:hypothetical protein